MSDQSYKLHLLVSDDVGLIAGLFYGRKLIEWRVCLSKHEIAISYFLLRLVSYASMLGAEKITIRYFDQTLDESMVDAIMNTCGDYNIELEKEKRFGFEIDEYDVDLHDNIVRKIYSEKQFEHLTEGK